MSDRLPPTITIAQDLDSGEFTLMATSFHRTEPAGDRLLHIPFGAPWPAIKYTAASQDEAEANAELLRQALANPPKKTRKGSEEATHEMRQKEREAVWNL